MAKALWGGALHGMEVTLLEGAVCVCVCARTGDVWGGEKAADVRDQLLICPFLPPQSLPPFLLPQPQKGGYNVTSQRETFPGWYHMVGDLGKLLPSFASVSPLRDSQLFARYSPSSSSLTSYPNPPPVLHCPSS